MPAISVLLPVRNAEPWLRASLDSLRRQTFGDFEVIAVDDGSTDDSGAWLERAATREPRLRVFHTRARGLPAALNTALGHARGTFLARHDADDLSHAQRFALQHRFLEEEAPQAAVVGCRVRLFPPAEITEGMRRWVRWHNALLTHDAMAREALIDSPLTHGTALLRRSWLERIGGWEDHAWPEDMDLWLRLVAAGGRLAKLPRQLYGWRQHPGSATRLDPRYGPDRFRALRIAALERGPLRGGRRILLVGVGASLGSWAQALAERGHDVRPVEWRAAGGLPTSDAFMILVFGALRAREARRRALLKHGIREGIDFVFVA